MYYQEAQEEYVRAMRLGQREYRARVSAGENPYPKVLDTILQGRIGDSVQQVGVVEIPADRIVGVKSAGRTNAFAWNFQPLLSADSEFARKWVNLCAAHFTTGIQEPILCYEYLGDFYVQEGNKRVSVLRHLGSARIPGTVLRVLPLNDGSPRVTAYYEFLEFYKSTGVYQVQFRTPGDYAKLLSYLGKEPSDVWNDREKRTFSAYFQYFREAFDGLNVQNFDILPEEGLLLWLQVHPFRDLGRLSGKELKDSLLALREDLITLAQPEAVQVQTAPGDTEGKTGFISRFISGAPDHVNVAFVHPIEPERSTWIKGHDEGRIYLENALGDQVTVRSYFHADSMEKAEEVLEQAVAEGAEVVFATTPQLRRSVLRMAVKYPRVKFLNCSVDTPYSSVRSYYSRIFEAKFITGALAGAMTKNEKLGYIASNPTFGVPASINAFALGAQLTNPRAKVYLRWSCQKGQHQEDLFREGVRVISNRSVPLDNPAYLRYGQSGVHYLDEDGQIKPIGTPVWLWGPFYETIIRTILAGNWDKDGDALRSINYWWGMDSGVIDVKLSDTLPEGLRALAEILRSGLQAGRIDPFRRYIKDQNGQLRNDGSRCFSPEELLHMDWLCANVVGSIPEFDEIEPFAQPIVRELGIHRELIPMEKEGAL